MPVNVGSAVMLWNVPWDGTFAAAIVAALVSLLTLGWTIRSGTLTRNHATQLNTMQVEAQKTLLERQVQAQDEQLQRQVTAQEKQLERQITAQEPAQARTQFMERVSWASTLVASNIASDKYLGLEMFKLLVVAGWATAADREYAHNIATQLEQG